jgi:hypothetical protein
LNSFYAILLIFIGLFLTQLAYPFNLRTAEPFQACAPEGWDESTIYNINYLLGYVEIYFFLRERLDYIIKLRESF